jgi:hypothetical protein
MQRWFPLSEMFFIKTFQTRAKGRSEKWQPIQRKVLGQMLVE